MDIMTPISFGVFIKFIASAMFIGIILTMCYYRQSTKVLRVELIAETIDKLKILLAEVEKGYFVNPGNVTIPEMYRTLNNASAIVLDAHIHVKSLLFVDTRAGLLTKETRRFLDHNFNLYADFIDSKIKTLKDWTRLCSHGGKKTVSGVNLDTHKVMELVIAKLDKMIYLLEDELK